MIREATQQDLDAVEKIHEDYVLDINKIGDQEYVQKVQNEGFVVSADGLELSERIDKSAVFLLYEQDGNVIAYADAAKEIYFPEEAENIVWTDSELKDIYFHSDKSIALHFIGVFPQYAGQGIARELFNYVVEQLSSGGYEYLFSIVTTGPVNNSASINFHKKMGFKKACETAPIDLFGLRDYESALLYKRL